MQVLIRLSKYLSTHGVSSRRKAEDLIKSGRVTVNGNIVTEPYFQVNEEKDHVFVDGNRVSHRIEKLYFALYKPRHFLSDLNYKEKRRIARELIDSDAYIFPVGRLDYESEGLMIFTNDGEIANVIMHPKYGVDKEYIVELDGVLTENDIEKVKNGFMIDDKIHRFADISFIKRIKQNVEYKIILHEGRNRIIRKVLSIIGRDVTRLKRIRIGHIHLGRLKPGEYRKIKEKEIMPFKLRFKGHINGG
ncbi:MAG: rRNA pseudouridine synthase [Syntrophorhabdaceae bacterium]|nr:rRNA pseudouridine synthase [Syntrophorhabdaceae bacterium]